MRYGPIEEDPLWGKIMIKISHLLIALSSALNIIIYSYKVGLVWHHVLPLAATIDQLNRILNSEQPSKVFVDH